MGLGGKRGRLTSYPERLPLVELLNEAVHAGTRKWRVCEELEVSIRTLQHWEKTGDVLEDQRQCQ